MRERKPTRRVIARNVVYKALREYVKAALAAAAAEYNSREYDSARWKIGHYWGEIDGAIDMAAALGAFGFSEAWRMKHRVDRVDKACSKRRDAILEEKRTNPERTAP